MDNANKDAKRIESLKFSWVEETVIIVLFVTLVHWVMSAISTTLATIVATAILGWTLMAGNIFTVVHSLAHHGPVEGYWSRLLEAAKYRHDTHHEMETDPRFVRMATTLVIVTAALNALAIIVITGVAWFLGWDWLTIMMTLSVAAIHWHHAEEGGHSQDHEGVGSALVRMFSSIIHKWHHKDGFPVTALYPYQLGGWYLVPNWALYVLAAAIAMLEGLVARIWPTFNRWLDEQVDRHRGEYTAVIANKAAKVTAAEVDDHDLETEDAQPA